MELLSMSISLNVILVSFFSAFTVSYLAVQSFNDSYDYSDTLTRSFGVAKTLLGTFSFLAIFLFMTFILS